MMIAARRLISLVLTPLVAGAVFLIAIGQDAQAQVASRVESGTLSSDDSQLDDGEYVDRYTFEGTRGQMFTIDLQSNDFDTFLQVHATDDSGDINEDQPWFNDDFDDSQSHSRVEVELPEDGTYVVLVTSYEGLETGRYELTITSSGGRVETGKLGLSDDRLDSGEYFDIHRINASAGQRFVIDLYSDHFDTYLFVRCPDDPDFSLDNDDHEADQHRSQIVMQASVDGVYEVYVTSFEANETGAYRLTISDAVSSNSGSVRRQELGELANGDERLDTGEYFDQYPITLEQGDIVDINLSSSDFDAYLFVTHANDADFQIDNDDADDGGSDARITMTAPSSGVYEIHVTSFKKGEVGSYQLTIDSAGSPGTIHLHEEGQLADGDETLDNGEFVDKYTITLEEGESVDISLNSTDFDAYLFVRHADDADFQIDNDDGDSGTDAQINMTAPQSGEYIVYATSFEPGETGSYEITIGSGGASGSLSREETGELAKGDEKLDSGEFVDTYEIPMTAGASYVIDLYSDDFDTYLFVRGLEDPQFEIDNDDFEDNTNQSQIRMTAQMTGTYVVYVTSYESGETGEYRVTIQSVDASDQPAPVSRREVGELENGDETLDSGEYNDAYEFDGSPGQHVRIELQSDDFDPYLILQDPRGDTEENDDFDGRRDMSVIEMDLTEFGTYRVAVTSFKKGETGSYELLIEFDEPAADFSDRDRVEIEEDGAYPGNLGADDVSQNGRYADAYSVSLNAGERVIIRMESDDFDSLMFLVYPDGTEVEFDDELGGLNAAIDLIPEQTGRYRVTATSYSRETTGDYTLHVSLTAPGRPVGRRGNIPVTPDRRILGVFVGISDYEGDDNDLDFCDQDAQVLYDIMQREFGMQPEDCVLLLNEDATVERVTAALTQIGERANSDDLLLFFYSGHGDQIAGAEDVFDPDGIHETLSLYDGDLLDDDFATLVNGSEAGISLVAIDSCFSGGFAKDVVSTRGRMGLFSSEEDVLSVVPGKFRAGGYLSRFLAEAVSERRHDSDRNGDGELTAHELSHFLSERYIQEVRSTKDRVKFDDEFVSPDEDLSFQRLVIDRGGLSHDQVLFSWE